MPVCHYCEGEGEVSNCCFETIYKGFISVPTLIDDDAVITRVRGNRIHCSMCNKFCKKYICDECEGAGEIEDE